MHHRNPSGRFLVAQAQAEGPILVTRDRNIPLSACCVSSRDTVLPDP